MYGIVLVLDVTRSRCGHIPIVRSSHQHKKKTQHKMHKFKLNFWFWILLYSFLPSFDFRIWLCSFFFFNRPFCRFCFCTFFFFFISFIWWSSLVASFSMDHCLFFDFSHLTKNRKKFNVRFKQQKMHFFYFAEKKKKNRVLPTIFVFIQLMCNEYMSKQSILYCLILDYDGSFLRPSIVVNPQT